jgi:hypothetical protein
MISLEIALMLTPKSHYSMILKNNYNPNRLLLVRNHIRIGFWNQKRHSLISQYYFSLLNILSKFAQYTE